MLRDYLRKFMTGRYGPDHLGVALAVSSLVMYIIGGALKITPLLIVSYSVLGLSLLRMLSKNIRRRRFENDRFLSHWWPIRTRFMLLRRRVKQRRTHRFLKCPSCRKTLRVPRRKGNLQITCPKCGERFIRRT